FVWHGLNYPKNTVERYPKTRCQARCGPDTVFSEYIKIRFVQSRRNSYFPFHALGFRSNPFRALTDEEWAEIVVLPPELAAAAAEAEARGGHLQILGDRGRGKTSALLGLAAAQRQAGKRAAYEYLPEGRDSFRTALAGLDVFLLDEAQRLNGAEQRR